MNKLIADRRNAMVMEAVASLTGDVDPGDPGGDAVTQLILDELVKLAG